MTEQPKKYNLKNRTNKEIIEADECMGERLGDATADDILLFARRAKVLK